MCWVQATDKTSTYKHLICNHAKVLSSQRKHSSENISQSYIRGCLTSKNFSRKGDTLMIYILDKNGKPLMPSTRYRHIKHLISEGLAVKVSAKPYVVKLNYGTPEIVQPLICGIDPGRTNIGISVITDIGTEVYSGQLITRNKEIPKLMQERKAFRNKHRQYGRRKKRIRRAIKNNTTTKQECKETKKVSATKEVGIIERVLPGCTEPIHCIAIKNKEARFNNRRRPDGWLTPTANHLLQTHLNLVKKLNKIMPISHIVIELNKFAFMSLDNPSIQKWQYQRGQLYNTGGLHEAVSGQQEHHCLLCDSPIEHYHHIAPKSGGGSNTLPNIAGLCEKHHHLVHTEQKWTDKLAKKKSGLNKKYGALSVLNQIIPKLLIELNNLHPTSVTDGYSTSQFRKDSGIEKTHSVDAYCIACSTVESPQIVKQAINEVFLMYQFRRQDRQACHKENLNRCYFLDGKCVAINRHKATEQKEDSFEEYVKQGGRTDNLTVEKHPPIYKQMDRIMPGALMLVDNKYYKVLKGSTGRYKTKSGSVPQYYNFMDGSKSTPKHCKLLLQNSGIVYL